MGLGLNYRRGGGGGDFLPVCKYDARAGRAFRVDREDGQNNPVDITRNFKAVFDMENIEVGWISFPKGAAPDFQLVPLGEEVPEEAPSPIHKQGTRFVIKLSAECGGDCREMASTAAAFLDGMNALHDEYLTGLAKNPGKLPVVILEDTIAVKSGGGQNKSTNYQPQFKIVSWVPRPKDLKPSPRGGAAQSRPSAPPSTGSQRVGAPSKAPAMAAADDEDFG